MSSHVRVGGEKVRAFLLSKVGENPRTIAAVAAAHFGITRQAVNKHLLRLRVQGTLTREGSRRAPLYRLAELSVVSHRFPIDLGLAEDAIWSNHIRPALGELPANVLRIWEHAVTEMLNNAIDHSAGEWVMLEVRKTAVDTRVIINDNGIGIFRKIQQELGLLDERHAIFELAKGKLTTDPRNHSGEGIFFTSRMCDAYVILSGGLSFNHARDDENDWLTEPQQPHNGTAVAMTISNHTSRTPKKVFDEFSSGENYDFTKTIVPVNLARFGEDDGLVSRSQAKRLLARVEQFKWVVFDFAGVQSIGQAFADQIYRVFATEHPDIRLTTVHASDEVRQMVSRALSRENLSNDDDVKLSTDS